MRKFLKLSALVGVVGLVLVVVLGAGAWRAAQHEDQWYREAVLVETPEVQQKLEEAGDNFERQALDLSNEAKRPGYWEAVFTDEQINAWLAVDLHRKFPTALPESIQSPRVKFEPGLARMACRVTASSVESVFVFGADVYLTENPNEVAIRLREARAGLLPIPRTRVIETVNRWAAKAGVRLNWASTDGDPVALIVVPDTYSEIDGQLIVENIEVRAGEIHVVGRTTRADGSGGSENVQHIIVGHLERVKHQR